MDGFCRGEGQKFYALPKVRLLIEALKAGLALCLEYRPS